MIVSRFTATDVEIRDVEGGETLRTTVVAADVYLARLARYERTVVSSLAPGATFATINNRLRTVATQDIGWALLEERSPLLNGLQ